MKHLTAIILIALASATHGQQALVDLTPGGYEAGHRPPVLVRIPWAQLHFFDEARQGLFWGDPKGWEYLNGWMSDYPGDPGYGYGDVPGGKYFFTNLFVLNRPVVAGVWWNFIGAPRGYGLGVILTYGRRSDGIVFEHLYWVRERFTGVAQVTVQEGVPIMSISFYGYEQ